MDVDNRLSNSRHFLVSFDLNLPKFAFPDYTREREKEDAAYGSVLACNHLTSSQLKAFLSW